MSLTAALASVALGPIGGVFVLRGCAYELAGR